MRFPSRTDCAHRRWSRSTAKVSSLARIPSRTDGAQKDRARLTAVSGGRCAERRVRAHDSVCVVTRVHSVPDGLRTKDAGQQHRVGVGTKQFPTDHSLSVRNVRQRHVSSQVAPPARHPSRTDHSRVAVMFIESAAHYVSECLQRSRIVKVKGLCYALSVPDGSGPG